MEYLQFLVNISMWCLRCVRMERKGCTIFWPKSMNNRQCLSHMPESPASGWKESPQWLCLRGEKSHCWLMPRSPHLPSCLFSQSFCDLVQPRPVSTKYKYSLGELTWRFLHTFLCSWCLFGLPLLHHNLFLFALIIVIVDCLIFLFSSISSFSRFCFNLKSVFL